MVNPSMTRCFFTFLTGLLWACHSPPEGIFEPCKGEAFSAPSVDSNSPLIPPLEGIENLLMISIDTLRIDRLGRYGCARISPFIDSLLGAGVVLDNHHSCSSWTLPSATCVMTGQNSVELGAFPRILTGEKIPKISDQAITLASTLQSAGFSTLLMSANLYISEKSNLDRGFDKAISKSKPAQILLESFLEEIDELEGADDKNPWFAHAHLIDPHTPYSPPEGYLDGIENLPKIDWDLAEIGVARTLAEQWDSLSGKAQDDISDNIAFRYGAEIRYLNDALEEFFAQLEQRDILDKTLIVLWSDHGEQFWEHGLWGHGLSLHSGENRAIAAFLAPGIETQSWKGATTHTDIAPTILHALGLETPTEYSGTIAGTATEDRPIFAATVPKHYSVKQSVSKDNRVLIYSWDGEKQFFDWSQDPFEEQDLYDAKNTSIQELWTHLLPEIEKLQSLIPEMDPPLELGP
jgi:arylsulfatase A-like enzyme